MYNEKGASKLPPHIYEYIGEEGITYIEEKLRLVNENYAEADSAIGLAFETESTISVSRHILSQLIFIKFKDSDCPRDILSVALALSREGAYYRRSAIFYFEKYFANPSDLKLERSHYQPIEAFKEWQLHSTLATLYENEYEFEKAIAQLELCIKCSHGENSPDFTRIGDILVKIDINKAEEYYCRLMKSPYYDKHKYDFDYSYELLKEKLDKGYVYKPRRSKKAIEISEQQLLAQKAAEYYI